MISLALSESALSGSSEETLYWTITESPFRINSAKWASHGNGTYDFGPEMTDVDMPVMVGGQAVVAPFRAP